jgi:hypothetical protein
MGRENDGIFGCAAGTAVHAKSMKVVKLFEFISLPKSPRVKLFQFSTGEAAKGLFFGGKMFGLEGMNEEINSVSETWGASGGMS